MMTTDAAGTAAKLTDTTATRTDISRTNNTKHMLGTPAAVEITKLTTAARAYSTTGGHCWEACFYCPCEKFQTAADFVKHLRSRHCTREGGSFVCRYGFNGVCPSLPLDGVSDRDYDAHVAKYHVNQNARELPPEWSVFSAAQNLPAVLNDPSRGKQGNLFTKQWGVDFVEKSHVVASPRLPEISHADFEKYLAKIGRRYRRHERMCTQQTPVALAEREAASPASPTMESGRASGSLSLSAIPEIFLKERLDLHHAPTFALVFPGRTTAVTATCEERQQSGRLLQEQLSHYLDLVEVRISHQVSLKSAAFFHALTTQDAIMSEMLAAAHKVRQLRTALQTLHQSLVEDSLLVMRYAQRRQRYEATLDKLRLMASVHKTQPMLQLLLGTQDYVAALELIRTTQEILEQELIGVHCFKHLPMQLAEMERLIDKMLCAEFERYATTDLNRPLSEVPLETDSVCAEEDKLVAIVMGLLRKQNFSFVAVYKAEAIATMRAIIKQLVIEVIAAGDAELCLTGAGEEAQSLSFGEWVALLRKATVALLIVLQRIRTVVGIMQHTTDAAAGHRSSSCSGGGGGIGSAANDTDRDNGGPAPAEAAAVNMIDSEAFLSAGDHAQVQEQLREVLTAVCHYCHERCANLVSAQRLEREIPSATELEQLSLIVDEFSAGTATICGASSVPLRVAVQVQASRYASRFHGERKQKLALLLDSERWRQVDIPNALQKTIERMAAGDFASPPPPSPPAPANSSASTESLSAPLTNGYEQRHPPPASPVLLLDDRPFALVGAALLLVQMLGEYCRCAVRLPLIAGYLSRNVVDLLRTFNSRSCQLIIGAGAMRVAGLKTITATNLALVSRALQLVVVLLPRIKAHFHGLDAGAVAGYEALERDLHGHIGEIANKINGIVTERVSAQLEQWSARPPVPSPAFRNISRHLIKLHEAIAPVLPEEQIHVVYGIVHRNFKDKLREQLLKLNLHNNGGPQHGVVTAELTFYMETVRTLRALPSPELDNSILEHIWTF